MALPIGETPTLDEKEVKEFFEIIAKDLKVPAKAIATPRLDQALKKIREKSILKVGWINLDAIA
jgi:hypothetical protein